MTYSELFEQRLVAHFEGVPYVRWLKRSLDMQAADIAFFRDYNAMNAGVQTRQAREQEKKNKPRGRKR